MSGSGSTYTVRVGAIQGEGTLRLDLDQKSNPVLRESLTSARRDMVPEAYIQRTQAVRPVILPCTAR